ncbi:V-type ATP synthase subunit I [Natronorubrum thiooxidans]|uniref:A-type ATP synthase subunit I n=1 Tax=Natronorubrum thiooxidans TaxID=308853 RepID=A0A1N7CRJ2_9EURY|nr:V-type ATP synthase subunit I [Natronorubrum thiooxidans]SIR66160.1 V/A-type H+-transporting ATPase subunit I [Natronorubrum thiooxidans]
MLRPERMSKVSVTGSKGVMPTVIETVHGLNLVHLSDYDGSWEGFDNGNPIEGADDASEKLVTVRALESTLGLSVDEAEPDTLGDDWEDRVEEIRTRVNELDDQRSEVREELRQVNEKIDRVAPFAELGIDLDLLSGYDTVDIVVGEGPNDQIEAAIDAADEIRVFELFTGGDVVAIVAAPTDDAGSDPLGDALVGIEFTRHPVPETEQTPSAYVDELEERKRELEYELDDIDAELEEIKQTEAGFLLRVEEKLTIEVQRAEAPLQFATTDRAFIAEGWIPSDEYDRFVATLDDAVGDSVEIEELERASYDRHGAHSHTEDVQKGAPAADEPAESDDQQQKAVTDGGSTMTMSDEPPVIQNNPSAAKPFEVLVQAVNQPKYSELDPTIFLFLTFPAFFGFMIGDVGYGIVYVAIGAYMATQFDSKGITSLGGVAIWAGLFTMLFGIIYGEIFGLHVLGEVIWHDIFSSEVLPLNKGLEPGASAFALGWMVISVLAGIVHLNIGYILDFYENMSHGVKDALFHSGSWILMLNGIWIWIFSAQASGSKPDFLFTTFASDGPFPIGFTGFPEWGLFAFPEGIPVLGGFLLTAPLLIFLVGLVMLIVSDPVEAVEALDVIVNVFSYTRMGAVLLAKAGMAFVVNLLFFGAYEDPDGAFHFLRSHEPSYVAETYGGEATVIFDGLMHSGTAGLLGGLVILVLGHIVVLVLGVTSAGLQGVRLEYVEFFNKFYEGGGENYEPFGTDRNHSED